MVDHYAIKLKYIKYKIIKLTQRISSIDFRGGGNKRICWQLLYIQILLLLLLL